MDFGWGLMIGIVSGANIGMVIAGLLAGAKRSEPSRELGWRPLQVDEAVWEDAPPRPARAFRPRAAGSPDPMAHL
jgi:hypothetical protein